MPRGFVLYQGPSLLDGLPIVAIATMRSTNPKTGNVPQTWILRADVPPMDAVRTGADASICGDCVHRGDANTGRRRSCYVQVWRAPGRVWTTWRGGGYPVLTRETMAAPFIGQHVRIGSYGDPAAVPRWVWERVTRHAGSWSGYTHQWRHGFALADLCMASVETEAEHREAVAMGYRTFRVSPSTADLGRGVMVCPASAERGHVLQCHACRGCQGNVTGRRGHVRIAPHGSRGAHSLPVLG